MVPISAGSSADAVLAGYSSFGSGIERETEVKRSNFGAEPKPHHEFTHTKGWVCCGPFLCAFKFEPDFQIGTSPLFQESNDLELL